MMDEAAIIASLRARETELRRLGVASIAVFGSVARGEEHKASDIDIAIRFAPQARPKGLAYVGAIEELSRMLEHDLGRPVDVVVEPTVAVDLQRAIDRDRIVAF